METNSITLIFRLLAVLGGVLIGVFAYQIYKFSKGGLKGWKYIAIYGGFLCFWAVTALLTKLMGVKILEYICGIIGLLGLSYYIPAAYTKLSGELNLKKPGWFNTKFSIVVVSVVIVALLVYNLLKPTFMDNPVSKILAIIHFTLGFSMVLALIPLIILTKNIRKAPWVLLTLGTIILAASMLVGQHYAGCCGDYGDMQEESVCEGYSLPYVQVTDAPCYGSMVQTGQFYQSYLGVGVLMAAVSFYLIAREFRKLNG
ncbi:MAG: hypothetical protein ACOCQX_00435 [Candidatus Nanoarchaeia archaeon]